MKKKNTLQNIIIKLTNFWTKQNCTIIQPIDIEVGAGTLHPMTCLWGIKKKKISFAYIQSSRRPTDGKYSKNQNKLQNYYQFQVIIKPSPINIQEIYLNSLIELGLKPNLNDIKFIEDNWKNPTIGAWGEGWEIWVNGLEISQFTYFQQIGGIKCKITTVEITYGIERIVMIIQKIKNIYDIIWDKIFKKKITYKEFYKKNEYEQSYYNFKYINTSFIIKSFENNKKEAIKLLNLKKPLILPAYENILKAIHKFNLLNSRKIISYIEKQNYITKLYNLTKKLTKKFLLFK